MDTGAQHILPVLTDRVDGPCSRLVCNAARKHGPRTRVSKITSVLDIRGVLAWIYDRHVVHGERVRVESVAVACPTCEFLVTNAALDGLSCRILAMRVDVNGEVLRQRERLAALVTRVFRSYKHVSSPLLPRDAVNS